MPEQLERQAEGYAKHLGLKRGSKRWDKVKYGTMRKAGWTPSAQRAIRKRAGQLYLKKLKSKS